MSDMSLTELEQQILDVRREISTDGYPMSIGELTNLYRDGELVIRPEFQRYFRWTDTQKSRLIESLLLGIPLPSIFVAQTEDGAWELVDGLQRVSTILQLQGVLEGYPPLQLEATKYLSALEGVVWEDDDEARSFSRAQRLDIKRTKLDVKIIQRESSPQAKFDLFQRLNSYGSSLTAQEIRSALLVAANPEFVSWLESLASYESFLATVPLGERLVDERYDLELVVRFVVLFMWPETQLSQGALRDFGRVLDEKSVELALEFPAGSETAERAFKQTFDFVAANGGEDIFRRWDPNRGAYRGSFLNTAYEVFALGLGYHFGRGETVREDLVAAQKEFWSREDMTSGFATGKSTEYRLARFIPIGRELLGGMD